MSCRRFVCVTMLLLLCAGVTGTLGLAEDAWEVTYQDLPTAMVWEGTYDGEVDVENTGTETWYFFDHALYEAEGADESAFTIYRWGQGNVSMPIDWPPVYPGGTYGFGYFEIRAPAWTTLKYAPPVSPTQPAVTDHFDCNFMMASFSPVTLITTDTAESECVVSRFPDIQPGTLGGWARFWIEELAGRVPFVVGGYPNGTYRPTLPVDRASMAVYEARALKLPTAPYEGLFPADVPDTHWAWPWIEAMNRAGLVGGYGGGMYKPAVIVNRDAMAVYVARGMVGGVDVPTGPPDPTFWADVPTSHWAYDEIEYCAANHVVGGYGGGQYRPDLPVTRDQMAVFVYRGFIQPTGVPVVLAGPTVTWPDPEGDGFYGWPTYEGAFASDLPGFAYVVFDAVRLNTNLAFGGAWDVCFELDGPESASHTFSMTPEEITAARDSATASGDPYLVLLWDVPTGLAPGGVSEPYTLTVSVEDETGVMHELARTQSYYVY